MRLPLGDSLACEVVFVPGLREGGLKNDDILPRKLFIVLEPHVCVPAGQLTPLNQSHTCFAGQPCSIHLSASVLTDAFSIRSGVKTMTLSVSKVEIALLVPSHMASSSVELHVVACGLLHRAALAALSVKLSVGRTFL